MTQLLEKGKGEPRSEGNAFVALVVSRCEVDVINLNMLTTNHQAMLFV